MSITTAATAAVSTVTSTVSAPTAAVAVATSAKAQHNSRTPTIAVATVSVGFIPIIVVIVIGGGGKTATMANTIAIDPMTVPESTAMDPDEESRISVADTVAVIDVKIGCRCGRSKNHGSTDEHGLEKCCASHLSLP
jgi:hypothetical protein